MDAVFQSAKKNRQNSTKGYWKPIIYSAAALLLIGITSGIFLIDEPQDGRDSSQAAESASVTTGGVQQIFSQPVNITPPQENLQPWVDNNEILYFSGQTASENSMVTDSIRNESLKKLTPVDPTGGTPRQQQLQLTGSRN